MSDVVGFLVSRDGCRLVGYHTGTAATLSISIASFFVHVHVGLHLHAHTFHSPHATCHGL
jgi:hypothetical protein